MIGTTSNFFAAKSRSRSPYFPVPEDVFAGADETARRHEQDIHSPAIDQAINDWNDAKEQGDDHGLRRAAQALVEATSAAFKLQGVPTFAHPVLPPQFVKAEADEMARLPKNHMNAIVTAVLDKFDRSVAPGGRLQFEAQIRGLDDSAAEARSQSPFVRAQSEPYSVDDPPLRPTLPPDALPTRRRFPPVDPRPKQAFQRPIGAKADKVQSAPPFPLRPNAWQKLMNEGGAWLNSLGWPPPRTTPPPKLPATAGMTWEQEFDARASWRANAALGRVSRLRSRF